MTILDKIVAYKRQEIIALEAQYPTTYWEMKIGEHRPLSLVARLDQKNASGVIAEHKRQSPSKGVINSEIRLPEVVTGYDSAGASGMSILTDEHFFGGHINDLIEARTLTRLPLLRKDFILTEYQIIQAKAIGADVILLIAEILSKEEVEALAGFAASLGLEVLLEMHDADGIKKISDHVHLIGINNRDLKTFTVDLDRSISLLHQLPRDRPCIAESGISDPKSVARLRACGFKGFLIGETFMRSPDPGKTCAQFIMESKIPFPE